VRGDRLRTAVGMCNSVSHQTVTQSVRRVWCQAIKRVHNVTSTLRHLNPN